MLIFFVIAVAFVTFVIFVIQEVLPYYIRSNTSFPYVIGYSTYCQSTGT